MPNLVEALDALDAALPIEIVQLDIAGLVGEIVSNPGAYGFTNVTQPCIADLRACDRDAWLFWDEVHPTTAAHLFLATQFAQAVPQPATLALLGIALALLCFGMCRAESCQHRLRCRFI